MCHNSQHNAGTLYVGLEDSKCRWQLCFTATGERYRQRSLLVRERARLVDELAQAKVKLGLPAEAPVVVCHEAGRSGFWVHRFIESLNVRSVLVDAASIEVKRGGKHRKTDRLDAKRLVQQLRRFLVYGERDAFSVVQVPTEAAEDERLPSRELARLKTDRTRLRNRIEAILTRHHVEGRVSVSMVVGELRDWAGRPLPARQQQELGRLQQQLGLVHEQISQLQAEAREELARPQTHAEAVAAKLSQLHGVGPVTSGVLSHEFFGWRQFANGKQVGSAAGLVGTPYSSGNSQVEQGISKAGNRRVRHVLIEQAWNWLRHQPHSALARWYVERYGGATSRQRRIGIVALARKLLVAFWHYLEHDRPIAGALLSTAT